MRAMRDLVDIVARLRAPDGCPWDRAQTAGSLRPYLLEEAYEVLDAIDRADDDALRKELGDLLFLVALIARTAEERGAFTLHDVLAGISEKMVRRHPHVFDPAHTDDGDPGSIAAWEARKANEGDAARSVLDGVPGALPALLRAHRISEKASAVGFDWPDAPQVREKVDEELAELDAAIADGAPDAIGDELGDLLFTLVNLGRHLPVGAEDALRGATAKFERRFRALERALAAQGRTVHDTPPDALEVVWSEVKADECC